jgi:uncharacterized protein YraI
LKEKIQSNSGVSEFENGGTMRSSKKRSLLCLIIVLFLTLLLNVPALHKVAAQQATGSVPTVTGTPLGPYIEVTYTDQINVRAGPSQYNYSVIGVLLPGQTAPAIGRSPGGDWVQISYPGVENGVGWVFAAYVKLVTVEQLRIVEPPPTPVPLTTPTINPKVAESFIIEIPATRIPTYTPPGPLQIPTYTSSEAQTPAGPVPMGLIIVLLGLIGGFGAFISFLRGR